MSGVGTDEQDPSRRVALLRLPSGEGLPLPARASAGAAGFDVRCAAPEVVIGPHEIRVVGTGFALALPPGIECQVRPRSGLAARHGLTIPNSPGTIDPDYRGEVRVILQNLGPEPVLLRRGDRIAQLVFSRFETPTLLEVGALPETARGEHGFGSTGSG